jgi:hypothetical protein
MKSAVIIFATTFLVIFTETAMICSMMKTSKALNSSVMILNEENIESRQRTYLRMIKKITEPSVTINVYDGRTYRADFFSPVQRSSKVSAGLQKQSISGDGVASEE